MEVVSREEFFEVAVEGMDHLAQLQDRCSDPGIRDQIRRDSRLKAQVSEPRPRAACGLKNHAWRNEQRIYKVHGLLQRAGFDENLCVGHNPDETRNDRSQQNDARMERSFCGLLKLRLQMCKGQ